MRIASVSRIGERKINEDSIGRVSSGKISCFVVADGLGGHDGGDNASRTAVRTVLEAFEKNPKISEKALYSYIEAAQNEIISIKDKSKNTPNTLTTIVVLVTNGREAVWGHIGDSRLYRFDSGNLIEVTDDHSIAFENFLEGKCRYDDIRRSPDQNKLTRTLGNKNRFEAEIHEKILCSKKMAFLLCTDGFWEYVDEPSMENTLKNARGPKDWLIKMLDVFNRNVKPGNDNYSMIALMNDK